jgi:hypothetical protein
MPESGPYGSVRGVPSNGHSYRDRAGTAPAEALPLDMSHGRCR